MQCLKQFNLCRLFSQDSLPYSKVICVPLLSHFVVVSKNVIENGSDTVCAIFISRVAQ